MFLGQCAQLLPRFLFYFEAIKHKLETHSGQRRVWRRASLLLKAVVPRLSSTRAAGSVVVPVFWGEKISE
jgi:hypothetical protein